MQRRCAGYATRLSLICDKEVDYKSDSLVVVDADEAVSSKEKGKDKELTVEQLKAIKSEAVSLRGVAF